MLIIVEATATRNRMRYNLPILVSKILAFLPLALISATVARQILLKFWWWLSSESNYHSRITVFSCIVDELKKLMGELRKVILWSDGCSSQFLSKFIFALLTHFDRNITLQWNYNEAHHGKGPMDGFGGTIKWVVDGWSNPDTSISTLLRNLQPKHLRCALNKIPLPVTRRRNYRAEFCQ